MATEPRIAHVEAAIGYNFNNKDLLRLALTAAGSEDENHDGNRRLAMVGQAILQLVIVESAYGHVVSREKTNSVRCLIDSKTHTAMAAKGAGIDSCIKFRGEAGLASPTVLSQAIRAIIGATWKDSSSSLDTVTRIVKRLNPSLDAAFASHASTPDSRETHPGALGPFPHSAPSPDLPPDTFVTLPNPIVSEPENASLHTLAAPIADGSANHSWAGDLENHRSGMSCSGHVLALMSDYHLPQPTPGLPFSHTIDSLPGLDWNIDAPGMASATNARLVEHSASSTEATGNLTGTGKQGRQKRRCLSLNTDRSDWLQAYIKHEEGRCREHDVPDPCTTFLKPAWTRQLRQRLFRHRDTLMRIWVSVCSSYSIDVFRKTLVALRHDASADVLELQLVSRTLSTEDRVFSIERTERKIMGLTLLKRCHMLRLWEDHRPGSELDDGWIVVHDLQSQGRKGPGNPANIDKSLATRALMDKMCPDLDQSSDEYTRRLRKVKEMERLGQRLSLLTQRFGIGILGLIPCFDTDNDEPPLVISDRRLQEPSNAEFKDFLSILDDSQGCMIRKFSDAAHPMIQSIFDGNFRDLGPFPLESISASQIRELPKGSPKLIALMSGQSG